MLHKLDARCIHEPALVCGGVEHEGGTQRVAAAKLAAGGHVSGGSQHVANRAVSQGGASKVGCIEQRAALHWQVCLGVGGQGSKAVCGAV